MPIKVKVTRISGVVNRTLGAGHCRNNAWQWLNDRYEFREGNNDIGLGQ
jgi:hypothetical protein